MVKVNTNYKSLKESYLFSEMANRTNAYIKLNPDKKIIKMGIGDVTLPLISEVVTAMKKASDEMGVKETFRGYGPEQGYPFLREKIADYYKSFGVTVDPKEIFIGDGAKSDVANITDIFSDDNTIVIPDPVYPVYLDSNLMRGRKIVYIEGNMKNKFLPMPNGVKGDVFYLCSPNNPTGSTYTREQLKEWVNYALSLNAVILYDSAYETYVSEDLPRSIFEIEGAKKCCIEFNSFSKFAGFTGTRCGYTVVPLELVRDDMSLNKMWNRRQSTKFNGVSYIVQRGAEAVFSNLPKIKENIKYYMGNCRLIAELLDKAHIEYTGGINSPYIWLKCPDNMDSWDFFSYLLEKVQVVGTPGCGFGKCGQGYFRLTGFNSRENTIEAIERLKKILVKNKLI